MFATSRAHRKGRTRGGPVFSLEGKFLTSLFVQQGYRLRIALCPQQDDGVLNGYQRDSLRVVCVMMVKKWLPTHRRLI
ncbi:hypothetical protein ACFL6U_27605 [Planctomycetota bacterium]